LSLVLYNLDLEILRLDDVVTLAQALLVDMALLLELLGLQLQGSLTVFASVRERMLDVSDCDSLLVSLLLDLGLLPLLMDLGHQSDSVDAEVSVLFCQHSQEVKDSPTCGWRRDEVG